MKVSQHSRLQFQRKILKYYRKYGRRFPWRETHDPYAILVSEVMLQQTQAERVVPKYLEWMKEFPKPESLAKVPLKKVLRTWSGLGYNRRALNLKRAAEMIIREYAGKIPKDVEKIDALPGVGPYTAGAIAAFAFGVPSVFIETNIRTVFLHFFFKRRRKVRDEEILELVGKTLPNKVRLRSDLFTDSRSDLKDVEPLKVREWYNALMDYGMMLKKTTGNPNARSAHYAKQSKFKGSRRELRGAILRRASARGIVALSDFKQPKSTFSISDILSELAAEGFLKKEGRVFKLA